MGGPNPPTEPTSQPVASSRNSACGIVQRAERAAEVQQRAAARRRAHCGRADEDRVVAAREALVDVADEVRDRAREDGRLVAFAERDAGELVLARRRSAVQGPLALAEDVDREAAAVLDRLCVGRRLPMQTSSRTGSRDNEHTALRRHAGRAAVVGRR